MSGINDLVSQLHPVGVEAGDEDAFVDLMQRGRYCLAQRV